MTIEQTVEIPPSRRVYFDVPPRFPLGKARITVQIAEPPHAAPPAANPYTAIEEAMGLAKRMGSTLTVEKFLEMKHKDRERENKAAGLTGGIT